MTTTLTWLEKELLGGAGTNVQNNGTPVPERGAVNFVSGVTVTDNPGNNSTDLTIAAQTTYTVDPTSSTVPAGYGFCAKPGSPYVVTASAINLALAGGVIIGLAPMATVAGGTITFQDVIPNSATGLGTDPFTRTARVVLDSSGKPKRLYIASGGQPEVGTAAVNGDVTVSPLSFPGTTPTYGVNLLTFGAVPEDSSSGARTANMSAWAAALAYISSTTALAGHRIFITDKFYLNGSLVLDRPCEIDGLGGHGFGPGQLIFPAGCAGLRPIFFNDSGGTNITRADDTLIHNIDILFEAVSTVVEWAPDTHYSSGAFLRLPSSFTRTGAVYGAKLGGDPRYIFKVTTAGYSAAVAGPPPDMTGPTLFEDGTAGASGLVETLSGAQISAGKTPAKYQALSFSGILATCPINIDRVYVDGATNMAVHLDSGPTSTNVNNSRVRDVYGNQCGGGVSIVGSNANLVAIESCKVEGAGVGQGDHGVGYWDASLGGSTWINCYSEAGSGPGFISTSAGTSKWIGCSHENYKPAVFEGKAIVQGPPGTFFAENTVRFLGAGGFDKSIRCRDISGVGASFTSFVDLQDGSGDAFGFQSDDDGGLAYSMRLGPPGLYTILNGWYDWGLHDYAHSPIHDNDHWSGNRAPEGPGHHWATFGQYRGLAKIFHGYESSVWASKTISGGKRAVGTRWTMNPTPTTGQWADVIVTSAGTIGPTWSAGAYTAGSQSPVRVFPDVIVSGTNPAVDIAAKCTFGGSSASDPGVLANTSATSTSPARVWLPNDYVVVGEFIRNYSDGMGTHAPAALHAHPSYHNGHKYTPQSFPTWAANTSYNANAIVCSGAENGHYFVNYIPAFIPSNPWLVGQKLQPTTGGTEIYVIWAQIVGGVVTSTVLNTGVTTGTEPTWGTPTGTDSLGPYWDTGSARIRKITSSLKSGSAHPQWDSFHDDTPTASGQTIDHDYVWVHIRLKTCTTEPSWTTGSGSTFPDNPSAVLPGQPGFGITWVESGAEPANAIVGDGACEWTRCDGLPTTVNADFVDDPNVAITPQSQAQWGDAVDSYEGTFQTSTSAAGQTILNIPTLNDNAASTIILELVGKQNGNFTEFTDGYLKAKFGRNNGGAPSNFGTDTNVVDGTAGLGTTSISYSVVSNGVTLKLTPGINALCDWRYVVHVVKGKKLS